MRTWPKVVAFMAGLVVLFGLAAGVGSAVGPVAGEPPPAHADGGHGGEEGRPDSIDDLGGLVASRSGYSLRLHDSIVDAGRQVPLSFVIEGPDGGPLTAYDVEHEKELHLIAVRRDLSGFQHVHPDRGPDGTWRTSLALGPGSWRLLADFAPAGGEGLTLGADLSVPGRFVPTDGPGTTGVAEVDGYRVSLDGALVAGTESVVTLTVTRRGTPVTDLQDYLGALGHLVVLREGDLAYLHVHPDDAPGSGPRIRFMVEVPSAGEYALFLDFRHDDVVRTASFRRSGAQNDH